jgi:hypothetical protein
MTETDMFLNIHIITKKCMYTVIYKLLTYILIEHKHKTNDPQHHETKWAMFTYSGREIRKITKLFRDTEIKIASRTRNTIQNIVRPTTQTDKYGKSGIYQMKCLDCPLKYIGQTDRSFHTR